MPEPAMDISIRELKANPAVAIKRMQAGERVRITAHRKVVAELVAPAVGDRLQAAAATGSVLAVEDAAAIAQLMTSGLIAEPAAQPFRLPEPVTLPASPGGKTISDLVAEGRGPR